MYRRVGKNSTGTGIGLHVRVLAEHLGDALEGAVTLEPDAVRAVYQRVASDAGRGLIRLAEAAVDYEQPAPGLHGALALLGLYGRVAVYDVAAFRVKAELGEEL